jgi:hypothetical protein
MRQYSKERCHLGREKNGNIDRTEMAEQTIIFKDVEDATHLAEDQNAGPFGFHIPEQLIENDHLS